MTELVIRRPLADLADLPADEARRELLRLTQQVLAVSNDATAAVQTLTFAAELLGFQTHEESE